MTGILDDVCCASLPAPALGLLAGLRVEPDVRVRLVGDRAWVYWPAGNERVLRRVLAAAGADLFARKGDHWYRQGRHLPEFDVPDEEGAAPLLAVLTPALLQPLPAPASLPPPVPLTLVRDGRPREASALLCSLAELVGWADRATTRELEAVRAARQGERVLLLGSRLPPLSGGERFWGRTVLVPLGWRPEPALPEEALRQALELAEGEIALLSASGVEVIPDAVLRPATRAGIRLALEGGPG